MNALPPSIAAESAILKQNVTMSLIKNAANQDQAIANILEQSVQNTPINSSRGVNLNTSA